MTRRAALLRLLALVAVIGAAILVAVIVGIPTATQLRSHFTGMGAWAPLLFAAFYAAATLSPLPKSVFTLAAGAVFGLTEGLPSSSSPARSPARCSRSTSPVRSDATAHTG